MSLTLAVAAGLGSALAYGAGTAGQHAAAYTGADCADAGKLLDLVRNPRWLLASAGDVLGILLQLVALGNGPVVLVQPLLVLSLPVAVVIRTFFGEPRPSRTDLANCAVLIVGLCIFFALLGEPHRGRIIGEQAAGWVSALALLGGVVAIAVTARCRPVPRAITFGTVAGCWFGLVSVLIEAVSSVWEDQGLSGFGRAGGFVPLIAVVLLAVGGYLLVQVGFQLGPLGASFPPSLIMDPVVAVVLGAALLSERVPLGSGHVAGYLACVLLVGWAALRLANADPGTVPSVPQTQVSAT